MRISRTTLVALLALAGAGRRGGAVTLIVTVAGGLACRLVQGEWDDPALMSLAPRLVAEIGWKVIEHAAGQQVTLCCSIDGDTGQAACRIDLGEGFEPLPAGEGDHA